MYVCMCAYMQCVCVHACSMCVCVCIRLFILYLRAVVLSDSALPPPSTSHISCIVFVAPSAHTPLWRWHVFFSPRRGGWRGISTPHWGVTVPLDGEPNFRSSPLTWSVVTRCCSTHTGQTHHPLHSSSSSRLWMHVDGGRVSCPCVFCL